MNTKEKKQMNTFQQMIDSPLFKSHKQSLEVVAEKIEMYYNQRIEETYNEVALRWDNNPVMLEWAEGEKERFLNDQAYDLSLIVKAMEKLGNHQAVAADELAFRSVYRVTWDGINLGWRVM